MEFINRDLYSEMKPYLRSREALVITGMRRTGKTTLLHSIYDEVESGNKLFLDLENPFNQKYFEEEDYEQLIVTFQKMGLNCQKKAYVFLDEIQFVKNLPSVVKYLHDHYDIKFFLTGSSSFYLRNLFTESMAGRKFIFELYPLNFREFLRFKEPRFIYPEKHESVTSVTHGTMLRYYEEYLHFGGFPGVVTKEAPEEKKKALEDIFSAYFQLEVVQLSDFRKTKVMRDLIFLLMQRSGSRLDVTKIASELEVNRRTIEDYLVFLEATYFIHLIRPFSTGKDVEIRGAEKVYICDSGLLNHLAPVAEGVLFENNVFQLLRSQGEIHYYQRKSGGEIDFILDKKTAYEVKLKPSVSDLKKLEQLCRELKLKNFYLIAKKYSDLAKTFYPFSI